MKLFYPFFLIMVLITVWSCRENCFDEKHRAQYIFQLELRDIATGQNLFLGNNALYPVDSFQFYRVAADSLIEHPYNAFDNFFSITCEIREGFSGTIGNWEITDTFYFKVPNSNLNLLTFRFNEVPSDCGDSFVESYDVELNEQLICDDCNYENEIVIWQN